MPASSSGWRRPINENGNRYWIIGIALLGCVLIEGLLAGACVRWPPQEWNIIEDVIKGLNGLSLMLAGGLLGSTKPS